jgi:hypothetical protein
MKWRRLLLALLLALAFDAVVPFEPTAAGKLQLDDDLEEAAQLRARGDHRRDAVSAARRAAPVRVTAAPRIATPMPSVVRSHRIEVSTPPPRVATDPTAPPPPGEDH